MLKIIEVNDKVSDDLIFKYSTDNCNYFELPLIDDKYTIESVNEYLNYFSHSRNEGEIVVGVIKDGSKLSEYHQNKLLKTFEDSADDQYHLIFIDKNERLLSTILSRALTYKSDVNFKYEDNDLHNFAKKIITSQAGYNLLKEEDEIFRKLYVINKNIEVGNLEKAILNCSKINFNNVTYSLFNNLILNNLYKNKRLDLLKYVFELEGRTQYNINLNIQALSILIEIKNSKEYYERSSWS